MTKIASPPTVLRRHPGPALCHLCEAPGLRTELIRDPFIYGAGEDAVELSADVPVHTCSTCEESYTGVEAEVVYHEAVCRHLGILTPAEIRAMRDGYRLTRDQFADLTGFGKATVGRWERGEVTQNRSADRYLRLLQDPEVMRRLRAIAEPTDSAGMQVAERPEAPTFVFIPISKQNDIRESYRGFSPGAGQTSLDLALEASAAA